MKVILLKPFTYINSCFVYLYEQFKLLRGSANLCQYFLKYAWRF